MKWAAKFREAIRVWWRPLTCVGIAASVAVNGVLIPLLKQEPVELMGWAAVITACSTAVSYTHLTLPTKRIV